jgi:hypothetical protein
MDAEQAATAWYGRQGKLLAHATVIGSLLALAADECRDLLHEDEAFAEEVSALAEALVEGIAAAGKMVDLIGARLATRAEEDGRGILE